MSTISVHHFTCHAAYTFYESISADEQSAKLLRRSKRIFNDLHELLEVRCRVFLLLFLFSAACDSVVIWYIFVHHFTCHVAYTFYEAISADMKAVKLLCRSKRIFNDLHEVLEVRCRVLNLSLFSCL